MTQDVEVSTINAKLVEVKAGINTRESIDVDQFIRMLSEIAKRVATSGECTDIDDGGNE